MCVHRKHADVSNAEEQCARDVPMCKPIKYAFLRDRWGNVRWLDARERSVGRLDAEDEVCERGEVSPDD